MVILCLLSVAKWRHRGLMANALDSGMRALARDIVLCSWVRYFTLTVGMANGSPKNVGLGKFWQDLEIFKCF